MKRNLERLTYFSILVCIWMTRHAIQSKSSIFPGSATTRVRSLPVNPIVGRPRAPAPEQAPSSVQNDLQEVNALGPDSKVVGGSQIWVPQDALWPLAFRAIKASGRVDKLELASLGYSESEIALLSDLAAELLKLITVSEQKSSKVVTGPDGATEIVVNSQADSWQGLLDKMNQSVKGISDKNKQVLGKYLLSHCQLTCGPRARNYKIRITSSKFTADAWKVEFVSESDGKPLTSELMDGNRLAARFPYFRVY